jgi:hypothetical protein
MAQPHNIPSKPNTSLPDADTRSVVCERRQFFFFTATSVTCCGQKVWQCSKCKREQQPEQSAVMDMSATAQCAFTKRTWADLNWRNELTDLHPTPTVHFNYFLLRLRNISDLPCLHNTVIFPFILYRNIFLWKITFAVPRRLCSSTARQAVYRTISSLHTNAILIPAPGVPNCRPPSVSCVPIQFSNFTRCEAPNVGILINFYFQTQAK